MLKITLFFLINILLISETVFPQGSWKKIKTPTDFNLLKICYLDSLHCWVGGDSGVIMYSSDQGNNWNIQNSGVNNYISDIFFLNDTLGWALTFELEDFNIRSKILKTNDGGQNWEKINFRHLNVILSTLYFKNDTCGWIGCNPNGIIYTTDGGYNWEDAIIDTGSFGHFPVEKINFSTPQYGFAVGGHVDAVGVCWNSVDSGMTWRPFGIGPDMSIDYVFTDTVNIISLTAELEGFYPTALLKFNLLDNSWSYTDTPEYVYITGISKRTPTEIWSTIGRNSTNLFFSRDTGNTWQIFYNADSIRTVELQFADSLHGIAVGENGYIMKYVPDSTVSVTGPNHEIVKNYSLYQNFPNPFNPMTRIQYAIPKTGFVQLKVFDILGNEIALLVNEEKSPGFYEAEFRTSIAGQSLASGIYFYQLKITDTSVNEGKGYIETKKMILLK